MITISLCMIVKNEELVLKRCLESVKDIVDEIIIVDTGSTDNTKKIALDYTDKIYDFKWVNDFSKARNYSFSKATKEYILWLDADDILLDEDKNKFLNLKVNLSKKIDIVMMNYNVGFDENGNVNFSYYRERLLKRSKNYTWKSPIHEVIEPYGNILYSDASITHKKEKAADSTRNLDIFESMLKQNIKLDSRQKYYYARELMYHEDYNKAIKLLNEVILDSNTWLENKINACLDLSNCYRNIGDSNSELIALLKSFTLDKPRAEITCSIGIYFMIRKEYKIAIYWFKQTLSIKANTKTGAFCNLDYYEFIPYINLCYCYYNLNSLKLAYRYNEKAGKIKPKSNLYLYNKELLDSLIK